MGKNYEKVPEEIREKFGIELRERGNIIIPTGQAIIYFNEKDISHVTVAVAVLPVMFNAERVLTDEISRKGFHRSS